MTAPQLVPPPVNYTVPLHAAPSNHGFGSALLFGGNPQIDFACGPSIMKVLAFLN